MDHQEGVVPDDMSLHPMISLDDLPAAFCWTRMGAESGEELERIIRRKEWERLLGKGTFFWGIGNPLGSGLVQLLQGPQSPWVVFSRMRSSAQKADAKPGSVLLWLRGMAIDGREFDLPPHAVVTSRARTLGGIRKQAHYCLVCNSSTPLNLASSFEFNFSSLRNLVTGTTVGYSQVTAVVGRMSGDSPEETLRYEANFTAKLAAPFFLRLTECVTLTRHQVREMTSIEQEGSLEDWARWVNDLKAAFYAARPAPLQSTFEIFPAT